VIADDVKWFLSWLEDSVREGTHFTDGETCQVGWFVTQVRKRDDEDLSLWEPDMRNLPVQWFESVSYTLAHLRIQKDVVESVLDAESLLFPSMRQSAIICTHLGQSDGLVMERTEPSDADSGWFCGCRARGHDHNNTAELRRVSLYEAAIRYAPQIIPYLALPPGILVGLGTAAPTLYRNDELLEFRAGSYLAKCHASH